MFLFLLLFPFPVGQDFQLGERWLFRLVRFHVCVHARFSKKKEKTDYDYLGDDLDSGGYRQKNCSKR